MLIQLRLQQQLPAQAPNDVWCIDFKGWWKSDGEICEPLTVRDKYSRKILIIISIEDKARSKQIRSKLYNQGYKTSLSLTAI